MKETYIFFYRKIVDWGWFQDGNTYRLFTYLLLIANFEKKIWQGVEILPGQVIVGRKRLAEKLGLSEQEIRTSLNKLKSTGEITIKTTSRFSVVTICKWEEYQQIRSKKQPTNKPAKQPTSNQQATTTKECKEDIDKSISYTTISDFYLKQVKVAEKYLEKKPEDPRVKNDVEAYKNFVLFLYDWDNKNCKDPLGNSTHAPFVHVLDIPKQLRFTQFVKHYARAKELNIDFYDKIRAMENKPDLLRKNYDLNLTLYAWIKPFKND